MQTVRTEECEGGTLDPTIAMPRVDSIINHISLLFSFLVLVHLQSIEPVFPSIFDFPRRPAGSDVRLVPRKAAESGLRVACRGPTFQIRGIVTAVSAEIPRRWAQGMPEQKTGESEGQGRTGVWREGKGVGVMN